MEKSRPSVVTIVALLQFIPAFLLPPDILFTNPLLLIVPLALFAFMAWAMMALKPWALTLCIFVQGLNVIVRFLILFPQATSEGSANWLFIITSLLAIALSSVILYVIDQPNVQVAFKA